MNEPTRARLFDLLAKNAPILFISNELGISPSEIVKLSNQKTNEPAPKTAPKTGKKQARSPRLAHLRSGDKITCR